MTGDKENFSNLKLKDVGKVISRGKERENRERELGMCKFDSFA